MRGLSEIADDYDGYIFDLWGVLHNGVQAFAGGLECLARLRAMGKSVLILSNAPRRIEVLSAHCAGLGIQADHYDALMSSGEDAWRHLEARPDAWYRDLGDRCLHLGPERDHGMRVGLDFAFVDDLAAADFILNTGALDAADTAETYRALLEAALARGLPMVCANPDLVVRRGDKMEICAGAIAAFYEELGGEVRYHGKPHGGIYRSCLELLEGLPPARILAVGDSIRTDIAGARAQGIDALFVAAGIHSEELLDRSGQNLDGDRVEALCAGEGARPTAIMLELVW